MKSFDQRCIGLIVVEQGLGVRGWGLGGTMARMLEWSRMSFKGVGGGGYVVW
jgi:hypothetical protein